MHRAGSQHKFFRAQSGERQVKGIRPQFDFVVSCDRPVFSDVYFFELSPVVPGCEDILAGQMRQIYPSCGSICVADPDAVTFPGLHCGGLDQFAFSMPSPEMWSILRYPIG